MHNTLYSWQSLRFQLASKLCTTDSKRMYLPLSIVVVTSYKLFSFITPSLSIAVTVIEYLLSVLLEVSQCVHCVTSRNISDVIRVSETMSVVSVGRLHVDIEVILTEKLSEVDMWIGDRVCINHSELKVNCKYATLIYIYIQVNKNLGNLKGNIGIA